MGSSCLVSKQSSSSLKYIDKQIKIQIQTINSETYKLSLPLQMTTKELKHYIYDNITDALQANHMSLYHQEKNIKDTTKLSEISLSTVSQLKIYQKKPTLGEIEGIIVDPNGIDPCTEQKGVAKMFCGHWVGQQNLTLYINHQINQCHLYQDIKCLISECSAKWSFQFCQNIVVLTKQERQQLEQTLSKNWIRANTKQCPKCSAIIANYGSQMRKVTCPSCQYGCFCYYCLNEWKNDTSKRCGNQCCFTLEHQLATSPMQEMSYLKDPQSRQSISIMVPTYRACPNCKIVFQRYTSCKHMRCICGHQFCWVCLRSMKDGRWQCGCFNYYCGFVAKAQVFD